MQLEEIYEAQLYPRPNDSKAKLQESLTRIRQAMGAVDMAFIGAFLQYRELAKQDKFYETEMDKLTAIQESLTGLKEQFAEQFLKFPHLNHPNTETRKDLV